MWTCKHCGKESEDQFDECWNCACGKNWTPNDPTPLQKVLADEVASQISKPPLSTSATEALRLIGYAIAILGIIGGIVVLVNAPTAPSDIGFSTDLSQIRGANRMLYLVVGWSQIVGGITTGIFLYVVAGIGDAVLDSWLARHAAEEPVHSNDAI